MAITGIHIVGKTLADGSKRYYYYAFRGGPKFYTTDGYQLDTLSGKKLPADFGGAYEAARKKVREEAGTESQRQSFNGWLARYRAKSKRYNALAPKSRKSRARYLDMWADMPIGSKSKAGHTPIRAFDDKRIVSHINAYREEVWGHSPSANAEAVIALSGFLKWLKGEGVLDTNRAIGLEGVYERPIDEGKVWTASQRERFLQDATWQLRHALLFGLYTGLRQGDALSITAASLTRQHLIIPTGKSRGKTKAIVPLTPELVALLKDIETKRAELKVKPMTLLFSSHGKPWSSDGFRTSFDRHRDKHGLGSKHDGPTFHDLRKTAATWYVIKQNEYPDLITDQVILDMFAWEQKTLQRMKRIYVNDDAVIHALTERKSLKGN